ncbi:hypothetical protein RUM43_009705 [Polyplax serrata]|uniref:Uncharacterized protein n=1 Tax=Polyplax serrata TaxID=468196 RepID=A0AAN8P356_POLSC
MEILMPEIQQGKSLVLLVRASRKGAPLSITDETATDPHDKISKPEKPENLEREEVDEYGMATTVPRLSG